MRHLADENRILISLRELVSIARRKSCQGVPKDEDEPITLEASKAVLSSLGLANAEKLKTDADDGENRFRIIGYANRISGNEITLVRSIDENSNEAQKKAEAAECRGEAFVLGKMLADREKYSEVRLLIMRINEESGESEETSEVVSKKSLDAFFKKCLKAVSLYAEPEIERITERIPSMKSARFPYTGVRDGQDEFIRRAYRTLSRGGSLFACAPTGTGKTVSTIYPALKALGDGKCDKVFYLTPKTTTAEAARECLGSFAKAGVNVRSIILTSKERSCPRRMICRENSDACDMLGCNRLTEAVNDVFMLKKAVVDINDIAKIATRYAVCPYEVELSYSELCDFIICDFNYLFDPVVYIRRFFTESGRYAFLIDEAHNLADRGREMYSAELSDNDIDTLLSSAEIGALSKLRTTLPEAQKKIKDTLMPYLKDEMRKNERGEDIGAAHLSFIPNDLYSIIPEVRVSLEEEEKLAVRAKDTERAVRLRTIRELLYKVKKLERALLAFDSGYKLFIFYKNNTLSFKLFCVDTGRELQKRLDMGTAAVFFSATLTPLSYYRSVLCDDRHADVMEAGSPFDPSQLSVSIMDRISTRYSERERTLPAVARVVAATLSAKRGHYMVFAPSFEYAEALYSFFSQKYPKIKCMLQSKNMSADEKAEFLLEFGKDEDRYLLGFCVMGGIYSEGIDLVGDKLIGAVVVGIGMPSLSYERECIAEYFEEKYESGKEFAYIYPGMNRVFQAAGRVIRREDDRGVIVLIDDRFADPIYKKSIPNLWGGMQYISDAKDLRIRLDEFWKE